MNNLKEINFEYLEFDKNLSIGIQVFKNDYISKNIKIKKCWSPILTNFFVDILEPQNEKIIVDVGAYFGYFSLLSARLGHKVFSFEPIQDHFEKLKLNIELNNANHLIELENSAIYFKEEEKITMIEVIDNRGAAHITRNDQEILLATALVNGISLDSFIQKKKLDQKENKIYLLKLCLEGVESLSILEGGKKLFSNPDIAPNWITMQISPAFEQIDKLLEMIKFLAKQGYLIFDIGKDATTKVWTRKKNFNLLEIPLNNNIESWIKSIYLQTNIILTKQQDWIDWKKNEKIENFFGPLVFSNTNLKFSKIWSKEELKKCAILRCFFGNKTNSSRIVPQIINKNIIDHFFLSNDLDLLKSAEKEGYKVLYFQIENVNFDDEIESSMCSKYAKHSWFELDQLKNYRYIFYQDTKQNINIQQIQNGFEILEKTNRGLVIQKHNFLKNSVLFEFRESLFQTRYARQEKKMQEYIFSKMKEKFPLFGIHARTGLLWFDREHPQTIEFCKDWKNEIEKCGIECQISMFFMLHNPKYFNFSLIWD